MTVLSDHAGAQVIACRGALRDAVRIALITGATGAMGRAIAERLAGCGHGLVVTDRNPELLQSLVGELAEVYSVPVTGIVADLADTMAVEAIVPLVEQEAGRLDYLVNNAGLNRPDTLEELDIEDWDQMFAVNLRAPMILAKGAVPLWRRQGGGAIVNIGSRVWVSGAVPAYTASKAGLVGLTRSLAVELGPLGVTANVVAPSFVDTAFTRQGRSAEEIDAMHRSALSISPIARLGRAEDIAGSVAFLLSDEASYITGEVLHVCGGAQLAGRPTSTKGAVQ